MNDLVSIVMPCYNAENYIGEAIESVLLQTYENWELLVVDDCSTDHSEKIIQFYCKKDKRIHYYKTAFSSGGASVPRNIAIEKSNGRFIAFLDSDDVWLPTKLEQQIKLFSDEKTAIVFSNHEKINEKSERKNRVVIAPKTASYQDLLKENIIRTSSGIYDTKKIGKIYFQKIGHEDFVFWLHILKQDFVAKNTNTVTTWYREQKKSLSGNKFQAAKWTWTIYRNAEKLGIVAALYYFSHYAVRAGLKYLK
jgi:glycosyltransferase involved in cell wall biosynthesis